MLLHKLRSEEEHQISLSKILPSWHHPQKMGARNEIEKYGQGRNCGHCQTNGDTFTQTTRLAAKNVLLDG